MEEAEDEEIIDVVAEAVRVEELPPLPSLPFPSPPPPSPLESREEGANPQVRDEELGAEATSKPQSRAEETETSGADNLMERANRLISNLTTLATQSAPLVQEATPEATRGVVALLVAVRRLRAFLDLAHTEALSPMGETKLRAANAARPDPYSNVISMIIKPVLQPRRDCWPPLRTNWRPPLEISASCSILIVRPKSRGSARKKHA